MSAPSDRRPPAETPLPPRLALAPAQARTRAPALTDAEKAEITRLAAVVEHGRRLSATQIGRRIGRSRAAVRKYAASAGIELVRGDLKPPTALEIERLRRLAVVRVNGERLRLHRIAALMHRKTGFVGKLADAEGVEIAGRISARTRRRVLNAAKIRVNGEYLSVNRIANLLGLYYSTAREILDGEDIPVRAVRSTPRLTEREKRLIEHLASRRFGGKRLIAREIAARIGRSRGAVERYAAKAGIALYKPRGRAHGPITADEEARIVKLARRKTRDGRRRTAGEIARIVKRDRGTVSRIATRHKIKLARPNTLTDDEQTRVRRLAYLALRDGKRPNATAIAREIGRSRTQVARFLEQHVGMEPQRRRPLTEKERQRILRLYTTRDGFEWRSVSDVARIVKRSTSIVSRVVTGANVSRSLAEANSMALTPEQARLAVWTYVTTELPYPTVAAQLKFPVKPTYAALREAGVIRPKGSKGDRTPPPAAPLPTRGGLVPPGLRTVPQWALGALRPRPPAAPAQAREFCVGSHCPYDCAVVCARTVGRDRRTRNSADDGEA